MRVRRPDFRIAAFSDVHGNIHGLRSVLDAIGQVGADAVVCCGDLLGGGGGAQEVIDLLHEKDVLVVRGNHDEDGKDFAKTLASIPAAHRAWAEATRDWLLKFLDAGTLDMMAELPASRVIEAGNGRSVFVCHAAPEDNRAWANGPDIDTDRLERLFAAVRQEVVVYGHFHQHHVQFAAGKTLVNVACVGMRYDGLAAFTFLDLLGDRWMVQQHHAPYDLDAEWRLIYDRQAPLPNFDFLHFPQVFGAVRRLT